MSIPDFERAQYTESQTPEPYPGLTIAPQRLGATAMPLALLYGFAAAVAGMIGYALIASTGFMVSIVAIGIGWLVARAMMTATGGVGGRPFQIAAALLTYFSCSFGNVVAAIWRYREVLAKAPPQFAWLFLRQGLFGPFLRFGDSPLWAAVGLLILFYALRTAWQLAAGSPGFGQPGGRSMGLRGPY